MINPVTVPGPPFSHIPPPDYNNPMPDGNPPPHQIDGFPDGWEWKKRDGYPPGYTNPADPDAVWRPHRGGDNN